MCCTKEIPWVSWIAVFAYLLTCVILFAAR